MLPLIARVSPDRHIGVGWPFVCAALLVLVLCAGASAQLTDSASAIAGSKTPATAPVVVDGRTLFQVRGVTAYPAEDRAEDIAARIATFAADTDQPTASLQVKEGKLGTEILGGNLALMTVFDEDGRVEGVDRELLARTYLANIVRAVADYRDDRTRTRLLRDGLLTLVATAIVVVAVIMLVKVRRALSTRIEQRYERYVAQLEAESFQLIRAKSIWTVTHGVIITLAGLLALVIFYIYSNFVLGLYPWTRGVANELLALLLHSLSNTGTDILLAIPKIIVVAIIVFVANYLVRSARVFFEAIEQRRIKLANFDAEWASPTLKIVRLLIIAFAAVVSYPYIPGSESAAFKGITIFLGVLFSLGSSSLIANMIAGYTMAFSRAFHIGDRISIGNTIGDVTQVQLLVTHLRSIKNEELTIPNSTILTNQVINFSSLAREKGLILHTTVGIGYEIPWRQVEAMLLMAAARTECVLQDPPAFVWQKGLDNFSVTYELNAYCDRPLEMYEIYSELHRRILDVFNEYGVQIMTPAYMADPGEPKVVPINRWFTAPAPSPDASRPVAQQSEELLTRQLAEE